MTKQVICFTDGSAVASGPNAGLGGYGYYFPKTDTHTEVKYGQGFSNTTTGAMELLSVYSAMCRAKEIYGDSNVHLVIYSDSQYIVNSLTKKWVYNWKRNGWKNTSGKAKNWRLWEILINALSEECSNIILEMRWVKGHQPKRIAKTDWEVAGNHVADEIADYKNYEGNYITHPKFN